MLLLIVLFSATPIAAQSAPEPRVVRAFCDQAGAHLVYDSGRRVDQKAAAAETCADIRVADDQRTVGWLMTSEATAERDGIVIQRWQHQRLFVNGNEVKYDDAALYGWKFYNRGRQVVFEAGPLHGGGNMFLYDVAKKSIVDQCITRTAGTVCPAWARQ